MTKDEIKINQWYVFDTNYYVFCVGFRDHESISIDKYISPSGEFRYQNTSIRINGLTQLTTDLKIRILNILRKNLKDDLTRHVISVKSPELLPIYDLFIKTMLNEN